MEIKQHDNLLEHIAARKWQMVVAKKGSGGFVTIDVPVCLRWSDDQDHGMYGPGFGVPDTQVIFSLSSDIALMGSFEGQEDTVEADIFTVGRINSVLIGNARNQVYSKDHTFNYMRPFPAEIGSGSTLIQDKVHTAHSKLLRIGIVRFAETGWWCAQSDTNRSPTVIP